MRSPPESPPGETHVVCKEGSASIDRLEGSIAEALAEGYELRPSESPRTLTQAEADQLLAFNQQLLASCDHHSIQEAVFAAGNNDRVAILPGVYTDELPAATAAAACCATSIGIGHARRVRDAGR